MRVELKLTGTVGSRPGGLQTAILFLLPAPPVASVLVSLPPRASQGIGGSGEVRAGQSAQAESGLPDPFTDPAYFSNQNFFGGRPSGFGELGRLWWNEYRDNGYSWRGLLREEPGTRNDERSGAGPVAEVRPQWLADP